MQENTKKAFVSEREGDDPLVKVGLIKSIAEAPPSQQASYPLLKPIQFTNPSEDDYLSLGVWHLKWKFHL